MYFVSHTLNTPRRPLLLPIIGAGFYAFITCVVTSDIMRHFPGDQLLLLFFYIMLFYVFVFDLILYLNSTINKHTLLATFSNEPSLKQIW